jgi:hypothetical protein
MNKLLKITGLILLVLLLIIIALYFLTFSPIGGSLLKPYIKEELEKKIGMPVEINTFDFGHKTLNLEFSINKQAEVNIEVSEYHLSHDSYEGIYQIKTDKFTFENKKLNYVNIKGKFKYSPEDVYIEGKGTALNTKVDYSLNIIENLPQQILLNIKDAQLSEVLQLAGHPDIAEGKIDVNINIPDMGGKREDIYGYIELKKSYFKPEKVKELYDYSLSEKSYVYGRIDGTLEGENVKLVGNMQSNLFMLEIKNALVGIFSEDWSAEYDLDVKDMRILTKNKLAGTLDLRGKLKGVGKRIEGIAKSNSLDGNLHFSVYQIANITFENIALEKVLFLLKQPDYAKGKLNGTVSLKWYPSNSSKIGKVLSWHKWTYASYDLRVYKGFLTPKLIEKMSLYDFATKDSFSLESKGKIAHKKLTANATLDSRLTDMTFSSLKYDFETKTLESKFDILIHDLNSFMSKAQVEKDTSVSAKGELKFKDKLSIFGVTKGLGKKVEFTYDSNSAKVEGFELSVEKILTLSGLPDYAKGTIDTEIVLTNLDPEEGTFSLKSTKLVTQPDEMKKLTGEALSINLDLDSSGSFKGGKGYINTKLKSSVGDITLDNMVYDTKNKTFISAYTIDIPSLKEIQPIIDKKLYGPLILKGELSKDKVVHADGSTSSLGGKINYILRGDDLDSTIDNVPLENILGMLGHKQNFLGKAFGKGKYNLKEKSGVVDLDIKSFQIKPSPTTNTIKMLIGKDPTRVIFSSTKFHADIKGKITDYALHAKGSNSSVDITDGRVNKIDNTNTAKFTFVYEKYTIHGKIKGRIDDPKVTIDTSAILKDKIDEQLQDKIEKALGGKAGEFLRGLKF